MTGFFLVCLTVLASWSRTVRAFEELHGTDLRQADPGGDGLPKPRKAMETAERCPRGTYRGTGLMVSRCMLQPVKCWCCRDQLPLHYVWPCSHCLLCKSQCDCKAMHGNDISRIRAAQHYDCTACPRGTYGGRSGLTSTDECIKCPAGTYSGREGRETIQDCIPCPPGTYGHHAGLTTSACSGRCPEGTYSQVGGLTDWHQCEACPAGYHGDPWMLCDYTIIPRKGTFTPVTPRAARHRIH